MITLEQLRDAHEESAGYCLFCTEKEADLPTPYASMCTNCGHRTVISAQLILSFFYRLDLEEES